MAVGCPMCGAPCCPNNPDGDGVGNWDAFDGFIVANAADHQVLVAAMLLLRRIAEGELTPDDPDEHGRYFRKLEEAASMVVKQMSFLPPSAANRNAWADGLQGS